MMQLIGIFQDYLTTPMWRKMHDFKKINQKHTVFTHLCHTHLLQLTTAKSKFINVVLTKFILSRTVHPHPLHGTTILKDHDTVKVSHKKITVNYRKHFTWHLRFTAMTTKTLVLQNVTVYNLVEVPWPLPWCHMPRKQQSSISCLPTTFYVSQFQTEQKSFTPTA